jgi:hypothetical protein
MPPPRRHDQREAGQPDRQQTERKRDVDAHPGRGWQRRRGKTEPVS